VDAAQEIVLTGAFRQRQYSDFLRVIFITARVGQRLTRTPFADGSTTPEECTNRRRFDGQDFQISWPRRM
jgi:hypothetical protein